MINVSLHRISRDNFISLVCAVIQGRMANMDSHTQTCNDWYRRSIIEEAFNDVNAKLSESAITIEMPEEQQIEITRELLSRLFRVSDDSSNSE